MENQAQKRPPHGDDDPPGKKSKTTTETPGTYSDAVRKKLQTASRTGQACDRCKERKMRCDANSTGCGPCQQKRMPCVTTDRITGRPSERGQSDRLEVELLALRRHVAIYVQKYGPLEDADLIANGVYQSASSGNGYTRYGIGCGPAVRPVENYSLKVILYSDQAQQLQLLERYTNTLAAQQDGGSAVHFGPIHGTKVDTMDGEFDIADFECLDMENFDLKELPRFNNSRTSSISTMLRLQTPEKPEMPSKEEALRYIHYFNTVVAPYVPILHGPSMTELTRRYYEDSGKVSCAETVLIIVVISIISFQMAVRNSHMAEEKMKESNRFFHYGLSFWHELLLDFSLTSMQALALFLVHARNLPKPGHSWGLSDQILSRAIELNYHRSCSKVPITASNPANPMAQEMRKRVFWTILGVNVTIAAKLGRPMPLRMHDMDIELPLVVQDSEMSEDGIALPRSGTCHFRQALQLFKLLPLLLDLYYNITSVRKSSTEYTQDVQRLDAKMAQWRQEWSRDVGNEAKDGTMQVADLIIDSWAAEFTLILHHPRVCTNTSLEVMERNLDICHDASIRLLRSLQALFERFKGIDFTWHSTVGYVLAVGITLHIYDRRKDQITPERFKVMKEELNDWMKVMMGADKVMRTGDHFCRFFKPRVEKLLNESRNIMLASSALQNGFQQNQQAQHATQQPPSQDSSPTTHYPTPEGYVLGPYPDAGHASAGASAMAHRHAALADASPRPPQYPNAYQYGNVEAVPSSSPVYSTTSTPYPSSTAQYSPAEGQLLNPAHVEGVYMHYPHGRNQHADALLSLSQAGSMDDASATAMWPHIIIAQQQLQNRPGAS